MGSLIEDFPHGVFVVELRGSIHHYPAVHGLVLDAGVETAMWENKSGSVVTVDYEVVDSLRLAASKWLAVERPSAPDGVTHLAPAWLHTP